MIAEKIKNAEVVHEVKYVGLEVMSTTNFGLKFYKFYSEGLKS